MSDERLATLARVRPLLADLDVREVTMFGAVAVMVEEEMLLAVNRDGSLLVRVDRSEDAALLEHADAERAVMGPRRRDMGPGWVRADVADRSPDRLGFWVDAARRRTAATARP